MKNLVRFFSVFVLVAVIAFSMAGCEVSPNDDPDEKGNGGNGGNGGNNTSGSTKENAVLVTVGYSSSHNISLNGEHWFKYEADGNPVIFETTGNVVDTYMQVYRDSSTFLGISSTSNGTGGASSDNSGEGSNALVSYTSTTSGSTYFIKITTRNQTSGTYSFVVKQPTANIRTNPIAVSLGNLSSHIINSSSTHWFKFEGTGDRVFFETESNVVSTTISIFTGNNTSSSYSNANPMSFFTVSGTAYYISITGNAGTYTFNVRYGDGDGSSRYNAKTVTVGDSTSHNINLNGEHWFTFFGTGNPVTFETTGNVVDTYMQVYRGNSTSLGISSTSNGTGGASNDNHTTGNLNARVRYNPATSGETYFIKITQRQSTQGAYTFVVE